MGSEKQDLFHLKIFTGFIVFVIIILILKELKSVFVPFTLALLLYFLLNGLVQKLKKIIPKVFILSILLLAIFIVFYLFGILISAGVTSFIDKFPEYSSKIIQEFEKIIIKLKIPISEVNNYIQNFNWSKSIDPSQITTLITSTFGSIANYLGHLILVLVFLMFMLAGTDSMLIKIDHAFVETRRKEIKSVIQSIENQVQQYLLIKICISLFTSILAGIIIWLGGIDFVIFFSILFFVLNFIPNLGSIVATLFPVIIGLIKFGLGFRIIAITLGLMITQFVMGNVVEPKITGRNLNLSPIVIIMTLIFWGWIWGIVGMILAVPLTSGLKIICEHIEVLRPMSKLISAK